MGTCTFEKIGKLEDKVWISLFTLLQGRKENNKISLGVYLSYIPSKIAMVTSGSICGTTSTANIDSTSYHKNA